jgi:hypothetical protein
MRLLSWTLFFLIVIVEGVLTTLPLTLIFLLCLTVMKRREWIFLLALLSGVLLDIFSLRNVGITSLYFICYILLILLYQRKYETATMQFILIASFFGSVVYLALSGAEGIVFQSGLATLVATVAFATYQNMSRKAATADGFQRV